MTKDKYTPGPWGILTHSNMTVVAGRRVVASCGGYSDNQRFEAVELENHANARLIAAALVLLDACQNAFDALESAVARDPEGNEARVLKLLRTAIYTAIPA